MQEYSKEDLVARLFDDDLSSLDFELLQQLMRTDPEVKELYYQHLLVDHSLAGLLGESLLQPSQRQVEVTSSLERNRNLKWASLAAVAVLLFGIWFAWMAVYNVPAAQVGMRFCQNASWSVDGEVGRGRLLHGQELRIEYGVVELELPRGVIGLIEGPAQLRLDGETVLMLDEGRGSFVVPESGAGFTVETARLKVKDLGTEFSVVANWSGIDEVHVKKGRVEVTGDSVEKSLVKSYQAVAVGDDTVIRRVDYDEAQFLASFPKSVKVLLADDFESESLEDGEIHNKGLQGWTKLGDSQGAGSFNPKDGGFYHISELKDSSQAGGVLEGMKGPNLGYIYGAQWGGFEREFGVVEERSQYTVKVGMGVRKKGRGIYAGYEISLYSGKNYLGSVSDDKPPGKYDAVHTVVLKWNSTDLPEGVKVGDPLRVQIKSKADGKAAKYLDFDNFRVTVQSFN